MADPITVTDLTQAGRLQAPDPNQPRVFITYNADFATNADVTLDFTIINQQQVFGVPRAMFIDNGSNPTEVEVAVSGTDQFFTVPAFAQGVFKIDAQLQSRINFVTVGGATDKVTITVYNWEVAPAVWYRFGAFNKDVPLMVQGTQPKGTDMDNPTLNNFPVYAAGADNTGALRPLLTDATGRLIIVGSGAGGQVYGPDADGAPPTQPPVLNAGFDGTNVQSLSTDTGGRLNVNTTAVPAPTATRTSVVAAAADTSILAANTSRKGGTIYNDSTAIMYLAIGAAAASLTSYTTQLASNGYYELPDNYTGAVRAIWASATGNARVTELS